MIACAGADSMILVAYGGRSDDSCESATVSIVLIVDALKTLAGNVTMALILDAPIILAGASTLCMALDALTGHESPER